MSWLARSLANTLRLDEERDDENDIVSNSQTMSPRRNCIHQKHHDQPLSPEEEDDEGRGVKEDLDEIKQTLTRQLWGMASFLAPPPSPSISNQSEPDFDHSLSSLREGERVESVAVSNQEPVGSGSEENREPEMEEEVAVVGITDEVLTFAMNIAMHPETWLDFPIEEEEDDTDDFEISDAQQEHAAAIERLAPSLAALRIELCPCHMSESYFWKVYFVLLHSRLHKQDAEILFTPQVMAARAMWMQELHKQMKPPEVESFRISSTYSRDTAQHDDFAPSLSHGAYSGDMPHWTHEYEARTADNETEKHMVESSETHFTDKSVIEENLSGNKYLNCGRSSQVIIQDYDDDEWPEEDSDLGGYSGTILPMVNEDDISFSDLEDDDYGIKPVNSNADSKVV